MVFIILQTIIQRIAVHTTISDDFRFLPPIPFILFLLSSTLLLQTHQDTCERVLHRLCLLIDIVTYDILDSILEYFLRNISQHALVLSRDYIRGSFKKFYLFLQNFVNIKASHMKCVTFVTLRFSNTFKLIPYLLLSLHGKS